MSSRWFRGGVDAMNNNANRWTGSASLRTSAVLGSAIQVPDIGIVTLSQFLANNTLIGAEAEIPASPNRGTTFDGVDSLNFWFNNPVSFGIIGAGNSIAGAVYYEGLVADPGNAVVWFCQDNQGGPFVADGGTISWAASGLNVAARMRCIASGQRYTFQGTLDYIQSFADGWGDATWNLGFALVRSTTTATPQHTWRFMSDLPGTVVWCTGGSPGAVGMPVIPSTDRTGPAINLYGSSSYYEFGIRSVAAGRTPITWSIANLTPGQIIKAVVAFAYQGTYSAGAARIIHWDDTLDHTIQAAQNVTYVQPVDFVMHNLVI